MSRNQFNTLVVLFVSLGLIPGCQKNVGDQGNDSTFNNPTLSKTVSAVSYPLFYLTQRIAGNALNVERVIPPSDSTPNASQIRTLQNSDLIIANGPGAPFAQWINRVSLPETKICNTTDGLDLNDFISVKDYRVVHRHGPEGEHSHPFMVAETWLAPEASKKQAAHIAAALVNTYPDQAALFQDNLRELEGDLESLTELLSDIPTGPIMTASPRLKFLTRAANLEDTHLLWLELPKEATWSESGQPEFLKRAAQTKANHVLFDIQPPSWLVDRLKELGYQVTVIEAFRNETPGNERTTDFIIGMEQNLIRLQRAMTQ